MNTGGTMKEFWPFALDLTEFSELAYDGEVAIAVHGVYHGAKLGPGYLAGYLRLAQAR